MRCLAVVAACLAVSVVFAGCVSETASRFGIDPEQFVCTDATGVNKDLGSFQYGGAATCKTADESYDWSTPSPRAAVDWGGAVAKGTVNVEILDSLDNVVYEYRLGGTAAEGASTRTDPGMPGPGGAWTWTVNVEFRNFTGTMGLDIDSTI